MLVKEKYEMGKMILDLARMEFHGMRVKVVNLGKMQNSKIID